MYVYFPVHYIRFWLSVTVRAVVDVVRRDAVLCGAYSHSVELVR